MFRGTFEHTLDSKGRVSVPRRFRDELTEDASKEIVLTRGLTRCLVAYPLQRWYEFEERVMRRSQFDPHVMRAKRIFVAGAIECGLDGQGRILVPPAMRQHARLEKDVVWVGQLDTIELWNTSEWARAYDDALSGGSSALTVDDEFAHALAQLGL